MYRPSIYRRPPVLTPATFVQTPAYFDNVRERILFPAAAVATDITVQYDIKTTDNAFFLLGDSTDGGTWAFFAQDGSTVTSIYSNAGSPTLDINGSPSGVSTRDDVHTVVATGNWVNVKMNNLNTSTWAGVNMMFINNTTPTHQFFGEVKNIKIDIGSTGVWDYESVLGNDNGLEFFRCP